MSVINLFNTRSQIVITCMKRLASYLEDEVRALGFTPTQVLPAGVVLNGTLADCITLNLQLRSASQVLFSVSTFKAQTADELYKVVRGMPWEKWLFPDGYFSVTSWVDQPGINTPLYVNVRIKDAIVDRIRQRVGRRPDSGPDLSQAVVHLFWKHNQAELFIDTSGPTLAKHGYRKMPGKAPMLEALAFATIKASGWNQQGPFVNPMCGSGTVAIEAALLATNRRPGLYRKNYAFMHLQGYDEAVYQRAYDVIKRQVVTKDVPRIIASDISRVAMKTTRVNAEAAGVSEYIEFETGDFEKTTVPTEEQGVLFINPEYGLRLGEVEELEGVYKRIGDFMKQQCKGYMGCLFTGNLDLAKKVGLKASRRIEFYSATLDCRLLTYPLYAGTAKAKP